MDAEKQILIGRLTEVMDGMTSHVRKPTMEEWSDFDLTMPQLRALGYLGQIPRRMSDLAAFLGSSVSSTTSLVERLEGKELVKRVHDPVDRRVVMCHLTAIGQAELDRFWRVRRTHLESMADILSIDELTKVVEVAELVAAAFERHQRNQEGVGAESRSPALAAQ